MADMPDFAGIDVALYRTLLTRDSAQLADVAKALGDAPEALEAARDRLVEMGLVRVGEFGALNAVSPMLAEASVLGAEDLELGTRRLALEQKRNTIRRLVPAWNSTLHAAAPATAVEVVSDPAQIGNVLMHYANQCREQLRSVAPGRLPKSSIDSRTRVANLYSLRRGIQTRAIYQHTALRDRHTHSYLTEFADQGARIRLASSLPGRSLVIDSEIALLPIPTETPGRLGLAVVREPNVVAWIIATFEQLWAEAQPFEEIVNRQSDDTEIDQTRAAILRLMAEGEKDEAISRRLAISVRTCRRHIAEYMAQVNASSRFQAGVIAARAGHLDAPGG